MPASGQKRRKRDRFREVLPFGKSKPTLGKPFERHGDDALERDLIVLSTISLVEGDQGLKALMGAIVALHSKRKADEKVMFAQATS